MVALVLICVALGALRYDVAQMRNVQSSILMHAAQSEVVLEGVVVAEPDEREQHVKLTIETTAVEGVTDKVLVLVPLYPAYQYGDRLEINGTLEQPENFSSDDTGREFNYTKYLEKDGIHFVMYFPEVEQLGEGEGSAAKAKLFELKHAFLDSVGRVLHEPYAALLGGLVVGAKRSLGDELLEMFRVTGLIHIVVLSGYNVTIVAESLMRFFSFLPRTATLLLGSGSIVAFTIMTGASATVVRASIMAILIVVARALGRSADLPRLLLIALFLMVMHNPYIVLFDPSFQLSFTAMLGLIYLAPLFEVRFTRLPERFGLRSVAAATIATQIAVLPMLLYMMGDVSLVAVPVNLLVLLVIPMTMLLGFIAGVLGMASPTLAMPAAVGAFILLYYEIAVVKLFAAFPHASVTVKHFPFWALVGCYALLLWWYLRFVKQKIRTA
jgi:competence protein ComEC